MNRNAIRKMFYDQIKPGCPADLEQRINNAFDVCYLQIVKLDRTNDIVKHEAITHLAEIRDSLIGDEVWYSASTSNNEVSI